MIGTTIGPYRVVRKLGAGGMGAVFEAVHKTIEHRVCIKILHPEYAQDAEFAQRFFNEARAVNRADHPGLVQVSDYGHLADGTAYIVMELVKGETLGQRLRQLAGPMPVGEVLRLGQQIADSLAAAHAKNIVHRDIKPDKAVTKRERASNDPQRCEVLAYEGLAADRYSALSVEARGSGRNGGTDIRAPNKTYCGVQPRHLSCSRPPRPLRASGTAAGHPRYGFVRCSKIAHTNIGHN